MGFWKMSTLEYTAVTIEQLAARNDFKCLRPFDGVPHKNKKRVHGEAWWYSKCLGSSGPEFSAHYFPDETHCGTQMFVCLVGWLGGCFR